MFYRNFFQLNAFQNHFLFDKNKKFKKSKNKRFSKGVNSWFWSKICHFSIFFFQAIQVREICFMCFRIFQNEKTLFQAIKTRSSKSRKIHIFPNRLTHGFGQKLAIVPSFVFGNISHENMFYHILERKIASLGYRKRKFKKSKN